ncbi:MAG: prepilin-type N-terminal cleavage/methylation domain-containing protein [Actinomycetota bacterium]|jgi:prepilin-type N-terminal cleavage/methylation domain-containing protein|nr:prepilin-type N-terminal cleavage/methylation domain-containing protein [Actinomycetota bacterium]
MVSHTHIRDDGFSLTELLVVLTLMGVLFAVSYGGILATYKGREVSDRQAYFASEISTPLSVSEKILTQAISIESPGDYTITVLTDRDNDNVVERHTFTADAQGRFTERVWLTDQFRNNTSLLDSNIWSTSNVNVAEGQELFYYYDSADQRITNMASVPADARYVILNISVEYDEDIFGDSRTVLFRNR